MSICSFSDAKVKNTWLSVDFIGNKDTSLRHKLAFCFYCIRILEKKEKFLISLTQVVVVLWGLDGSKGW